MGKKTAIAGALIGVMALGAVAGYVLPSSAAGGSRHKTIVVFAPNKKDHEFDFDAGDHGFSTGDYSTGHGAFMHHQKRAGSFTRVCHNINVNREARNAVLQCEAVAFLDGGRVTVLGDIRFGNGSQSAHLSITGGSGIYRDASGTLQINFNKHPTPFTFDIDY